MDCTSIEVYSKGILVTSIRFKNEKDSTRMQSEHPTKSRNDGSYLFFRSFPLFVFYPTVNKAADSDLRRRFQHGWRIDRRDCRWAIHVGLWLIRPRSNHDALGGLADNEPSTYTPSQNRASDTHWSSDGVPIERSESQTCSAAAAAKYRRFPSRFQTEHDRRHSSCPRPHLYRPPPDDPSFMRWSALSKRDSCLTVRASDAVSEVHKCVPQSPPLLNIVWTSSSEGTELLVTPILPPLLWWNVGIDIGIDIRHPAGLSVCSHVSR